MKILPSVLFYAANEANLMWNTPFVVLIMPVGVVGYELTRNLTEKLKDSLPDPEELEEKFYLNLVWMRAFQW